MAGVFYGKQVNEDFSPGRVSGYDCHPRRRLLGWRYLGSRWPNRFPEYKHWRSLARFCGGRHATKTDYSEFQKKRNGQSVAGVPAGFRDVAIYDLHYRISLATRSA